MGKTQKAGVEYDGQDEKIGREFKWTLRKGGEKNIIFWQGCLRGISNEPSQRRFKKKNEVFSPSVFLFLRKDNLY